MNSRSLLVVVALTLVFFFVNNYFTGKKVDQHKQTAQISDTAEVPQGALVDLNSFPLAALFQSSQGRTPLAQALEVGGLTYVAFSWGEKPPEELFARGKNGILEPVKLVGQGAGNILLYSGANNPTFNTTFLPEIGSQPIQLLMPDPALEASVMSAAYQEGRLYFPGKTFPNRDGIAPYQMEGNYYPVGFYSAENKNFTTIGNLPELATHAKYTVESADTTVLAKEEFYVLQNGTMQIVFSTVGGAVTEINLPFKSEKFPKSVVLPIGVDKSLEKNYPANDKFPSKEYYYIDEGGKRTVGTPVLNNFYPLLRRGIEPGSGLTPTATPPQNYALNIVSEDPETAEALYTVTRFEKDLIEFSARLPQRTVTKTFTFPEEGEAAPYCFNVTVRVEGDNRGLWITSGVPEVEMISNNPAPIIKYSTVQNQKHVTEKLSLPKTSTNLSSFQPNWVSNANGYFSIILDPLTDIGSGLQANLVPGEIDPSRIILIDHQHDLYTASKFPGYNVHLPLATNSKPMTFRVIATPLDDTILKQLDATFTDPVTGYNPHYVNTQSFHGWLSFISEPFAKFLLIVMNLLHMVTHSWAISIILLAVVLRVMLYPLNAWSIKSTLKMQELSPKMSKMQEKYKKDPKKNQAEMMKFYRENKVNPFGGCLPLLIQMPFLIGMMDLLKSTFALRGSSFIPGWITNLSAPDVLFTWGYPIPFIGTSFHLLPILLGGVMYVQQKFMSAQNKSATSLTDQQKQMKKMGSVMTIFFTVMFYNMPSGLNLYWLTSMGLAIFQQYYMMKRAAKKKENPREIVINKKS